MELRHEPRVTGVAVLRELKKINPAIKAYLLSGFSEIAEEPEKLMREGFAGFIAKPFQDEDIARLVA